MVFPYFLTMARSPTDFNDCVSKGELTTFITEQRNLMTELTRNVNNLVTCIEQIEQRPQSHHGDDGDVDGDLSDHEDMDDDGDARNRRRYIFNHRGMEVITMVIMIPLLKLNLAYLLLLVMLILRHI